jgi:serine/threonine-protein kinase
MTNGAASEPRDARGDAASLEAGPGAERRDPEDDERDARLADLLLAAEGARRSGAELEVGALEPRREPRGELESLCRLASLLDDLGAPGPESAAGSTADLGAAGGQPPHADRSRAVLAAGELPRLFGEYELIEEIGRGGMGVVYRARQRRLERLVALKVILRGELASQAEIARFRVEAETAARIDHPNAAKVFDAGEIDGRPYFTMQLVEGTTLAERLRAGPLPPRETAALLAPVCRAVQAAHELGLLHRDLKPANILIDRGGRPYVVDFGLAKRTEGVAGLTGSGSILGTPRYMAPEQAAGDGRRVSPASDVYSLGVILYECLTGRVPFDGPSPLAVIRSVCEEEPPLPRSFAGAVDRELEVVALRCLQKPADLRYATAAKLAEDLEAYLDGMPVAARTGRFGDVVARVFRETHHAAVLEQWGLLWMWHAAVILVLSLLTHSIRAHGVLSVWPYFGLWGAGLGAWAAIFWSLRRRAGPVTFVERQIAHIWAASVISCSGLFLVEMILGLPVLTLSPVLGLVGATVFLSKAGVLSGRFYFQAALLFITAPVMALLPRWSLLVFGVVSAACFFLPGWRYHRALRPRGRSPAPPAKAP